VHDPTNKGCYTSPNSPQPCKYTPNSLITPHQSAVHTLYLTSTSQSVSLKVVHGEKVFDTSWQARFLNTNYMHHGFVRISPYPFPCNETLFLLTRHVEGQSTSILESFRPPSLTMQQGIGTVVSPTEGRSPTDIVKNIQFECTYHFRLTLNDEGALPILTAIFPEGDVSNYTTTTNTMRKQPSCNSAAS
jgi:hypothetical protein